MLVKCGIDGQFITSLVRDLNSSNACVILIVEKYAKLWWTPSLETVR